MRPMPRESDEAPNQHFSRGHWLAENQFQKHSDSEILSLIANKVKTLATLGPKPVVLLDLDSTLYEVAPRSYGIIREWIQLSGSKLQPQLLEVLHRLEESHVGYSLNDTLHALGLDIKSPEIMALAADLKTYWWPRFFSNDYLRLDRPYPGAVEFASELSKLGAHLIYLTGRERAKMEGGTIANLKRDEFPQGDRTTLWMKEDSDLDDMTYKLQAAKRVRMYGDLVASFENEPRNLVGLSSLYPNAFHVFVETVCSETPAPKGEGIYRLKRFASFSNLSNETLTQDPSKER